VLSLRYRSQPTSFHWHLEAQDIRHVYIRPRTAHLNVKVESSNRVDEQEFYQLLDRDRVADDIHLLNDKLRERADHCNYHRPHGALDGQTPYERLLARNRCQCVTKILRPYTQGGTWRWPKGHHATPWTQPRRCDLSVGRVLSQCLDEHAVS
jgi:Integrase core domain